MTSNSQLLPCCFYPTTIVLVDDDEKLLESWEALFAEHDFLCVSFSKPQEALEFINNQKTATLKELCLRDAEQVPNDYEPHNSNQYQMSIDTSCITNLRKSPDRHKTVTVVITDYAMPNMNGIEFCRQINNPLIYKAILTGAADERLALEAFNHGIIHQFMMKNNPEIKQTLFDQAMLGQRQYFMRQSELIYTAYDDSLLSRPYLSSPSFIQWFFNWIQENHIIEYYLNTDSHGLDFLLMDHHKNESILSIRSEADINDGLLVAAQDHNADGALDNIINDLQAKKSMPVFMTTKQVQASPSTWKPLMHTMSKVPADLPQTLYYSHNKVSA